MTWDYTSAGAPLTTSSSVMSPELYTTPDTRVRNAPVVATGICLPPD